MNIQVPQNESWDITGMDMKIPYTAPIASNTTDQNTTDVVEDDELMIENVFFDFDRFDIKDEHAKNLEMLSEWLVKNPNAKISITGHTDYYGDPEYNIELSKNRVLKTKWFLTGKGVKTGQIVVHFYGESQGITIPVEDDNIRHLNRRVVVEVLDQGDPPMEVKPIEVPEGFKVK